MPENFVHTTQRINDKKFYLYAESLIKNKIIQTRVIFYLIDKAKLSLFWLFYKDTGYSGLVVLSKNTINSIYDEDETAGFSGFLKARFWFFLMSGIDARLKL